MLTNEREKAKNTNGFEVDFMWRNLDEWILIIYYVCIMYGDGMEKNLTEIKITHANFSWIDYGGLGSVVFELLRLLNLLSQGKKEEKEINSTHPFFCVSLEWVRHRQIE